MHFQIEKPKTYARQVGKLKSLKNIAFLESTLPRLPRPW